MYTKRHYEDIAKLVKNTCIAEKKLLVETLAKHFLTDNPKFKTEKFLRACDIKETV